jgi:hypothetical protein
MCGASHLATEIIWYSLRFKCGHVSSLGRDRYADSIPQWFYPLCLSDYLRSPQLMPCDPKVRHMRLSYLIITWNCKQQSEILYKVKRRNSCWSQATTTVNYWHWVSSRTGTPYGWGQHFRHAASIFRVEVCQMMNFCVYTALRVENDKIASVIWFSICVILPARHNILPNIFSYFGGRL